MTVHMRNGTDADDDFLFMTRSRNFVKAGGTFSTLVAKIVQSYNNKVF